MTSSISSVAHHAAATVTNHWRAVPPRVRYASLLLTLLPATGFLLTHLLHDYHAWKSLGPGGLPHDFWGYILNNLLAIYAGRRGRDTINTTPYDNPARYCPGWKEADEQEREGALRRFLRGELERRKGLRTRALKFAAPQRERGPGEWKVPVVKEAYHAAFHKLVTDYPDAVELHTSILERHGDALFVPEDKKVPYLAETAQREIAHIHTSDLSAHVVLSLADAREVVAKGWGERHRASGTRLLPLGYTMVYVPRTVEEVEVCVEILRAGVEYMRSCETAG